MYNQVFPVLRLHALFTAFSHDGLSYSLYPILHCTAGGAASSLSIGRLCGCAILVLRASHDRLSQQLEKFLRGPSYSGYVQHHVPKALNICTVLMLFVLLGQPF